MAGTDADRYVAPATLTEAVALLEGGDRVVLAGGTDFYPARVGRALSEPVLDISRIGELRGIGVSPDGGVRFGAATTWSDVVRADLPPRFDGLRAAAAQVGSVQIQNAGTVGGNLCNASPAADGVPPLLTLDAAVELTSAAGTRRLPLADFLTGYRATALATGELLSSIVVPPGAPGRSAFLKLGSRRYLVISIVMVAAVVDVGDDGTVASAAVAVGACSPVARRLHALENDLVGVAAGDAPDVAGAGHLADLAPIDDVRAGAGYRRHAALTLVRRALADCVEVAP